jgi:preprotein translocase subunit YajC
MTGMRERIVWILLLVLGTGGGFYAGRLNGIQVGQTQVQQTAARFLADRGGTGGAGAGGAAGANGAAGGTRRGAFAGQNLFGTVSRVNGTTVTVTARDNTTTTVQLNANATIRKQVSGQVSDIHPGDQIVVIGTKSGTVFQASSVQLGTGLGFGGRGGANQNRSTGQ